MKLTGDIQTDIRRLNCKIEELAEGGIQGESAYQIALDNGFVGTEEQWLESLEGPPGPAGADGDITPALEALQQDVQDNKDAVDIQVGAASGFASAAASEASNAQGFSLAAADSASDAAASASDAAIFGIGASTAAPGDTPDGTTKIYNVSSAGTYTNFGGIVVSSGDLNAGLVQLRFVSGAWTKVITPLNVSSTVTIQSGAAATGFTEVGFVTSAGVYNTSTNWRTTTVAVTPSIGKIVYSMYGGTGANAVSFFDKDNVYLSGVAYVASGVPFNGEIAVPANARFAKVSGTNANIASLSYSYTATFANLNDLVAYINGELHWNKELASQVSVRYTDFPTNGFYPFTGAYNTASTFGSATVTVTPGKLISYKLFSTNAGSGARLITFFNAANGEISNIQSTQNSQYHIGSTVVPALAVKMVISILRSGTDSYYDITDSISNALQNINSVVATKANAVSTALLKVSKTVPGNGTTLFNTLTTAVAAWKPGDEIRISDGVYLEDSVNIPDKATISFIGSVEMRGYLPVTATTVDVDAKSTIDFKNSGKLKFGKITAKNMRYPLHSDFGSPEGDQYYEGIILIHYGNNEIYAYRVANNTASPNHAAAVWRAQSAAGIGSQSGARLVFNACHVESVMRAFSTHNNLNYHLLSGASIVEIKNSVIISHGVDLDNTELPFKPAVFVQSLASFTDDLVIIRDNIINGELILQSSSQDWREFTQRVILSGNSRHLRQIRHTVGSSKGMVYQTEDKNAFIIKVTSPNTSAVVITGNLADSIMLNYSSLKGNADMNSYVKGKVNANTAFANVNAYSGAKTVTFTAGSEVKAITLTGGYATAQALVNDMNTQFGVGSFYAETYWSGLDWYPQCVEEIENKENTGPLAIYRGRGVKRNGVDGIAPWTNADATSACIGIALQDIPVGSVGDVKTKGYMLRIWVDGLESTTLPDGTWIKGTPTGSFVISPDGSDAVFRCGSNENIDINL